MTASPPPARLASLACAVPEHELDQDDVAARAAEQFPKLSDIERLLPVFANTGIERRFSCVPIEWYLKPRGWVERTELFLEHSQKLLESVAVRLLAKAGKTAADVDAVVAVTTTGIATPSLDALIIERMGLRRNVVRLPIFGLGCAGGVIGLARAADLARSRPGSNVLFLAVELCALTFRRDDYSKSNIVATALFGDGAAGALISTDAAGPALGPSYDHTWPDTLDVMGWDVMDDGLKPRFARSIPTLVETEFPAVLDQFFADNQLAPGAFKSYACHPGGAKVLDALEDVLGLERGGLADSREILRGYGNMSAVTVLFVLERLLAARAPAPILMTTLGPGFSAGLLAVGLG